MRYKTLLALIDIGHLTEARKRLVFWIDKDAEFTARHHCEHCGEKCLDSYMVTAKLWEHARMGKGFLHLRCLEDRSGRKLVLGDFTDAACNNELRFGYELGRRDE
jgi:hypothetical protein